MGKRKAERYVNVEIDALAWGARKAGMSYGQYVSTIDEREKARIIKAFKKERRIGEDGQEE